MGLVQCINIPLLGQKCHAFIYVSILSSKPLNSDWTHVKQWMGFCGKECTMTWGLSLRWVFGRWKYMGDMGDGYKCIHDGNECERW